ncbi:50S ribosomal protein L15 [Candidatus Kuenenbacteria bacterium RIFCSPHIGHO2_02_FULL_39_13]|uniref:Large ribosomal subunit protein uL15 n=1 Tax=Candidatus Kuenenbacteria bacterium RIFCSPHIGHO2_02_FULL_39_13 TaxID=1798561 RepID=A0A1F6FP66_9BACT|nr:MAG: 50S ribosomal protein L15 [Candidatus Kuenenbacteria bacterium RIFCSPHIGHO2_02_FULL_39_13]
MALNLSNLKPSPHSVKKHQRVGRGGKRGTYSGRGLKGQRARSGGGSGLKRLGMRQLMERTHKLKGFKSIHPKPVIISLDTLNKNFQDGARVDPRILLKKKLVAKISNGVKILSNGKIQVKLTVANCRLSKTAQAAIEQAGGKII